MIKKFLLLFTALTLSSIAQAATVTPGTYVFSDHPLTGSFGLILEGLNSPTNPGTTFSVERNGANVSLFWDGGNTAIISGQVWNNQSGGLWTVEQTLTGVTAFQSGFAATGGGITITDPMSNTFNIGPLTMDGHSFLALGDSHLCGNLPNCGPLIAQGWFEGDYTNDWLVQISPVPIPAALPLFTTGLLLLLGGLSRRK